MSETRNRKHLLETFLAEVRGYLAQTERFLDSDPETPAVEDGHIVVYSGIHNLKGVAGLMEMTALHQAAELLLHHLNMHQNRLGLTLGDIQELLRDFIDEMSWMLVNIEAGQIEKNDDILRRLRERWPEPRQPETRASVGSFTEELIGLFVTELFQGLSGLREALETLIKEPQDSAAKTNVFRHCMNLRGSAAMIEIKPLEKVLHMGAELSERAEKQPHESPQIWNDFKSVVEVLQKMAEQLYARRRLEDGVADGLLAELLKRYPDEMRRTISRFDEGEAVYDEFDEEDAEINDDEEVERELKEIFMQEGSEHLRLLADQIVELENHPGSRELLNQLFRTVHTLKGAAATAGYRQLSEMAHGVEDVLDMARENRIPSGKDLLDLLYHSEPLMRAALGLEAGDQGGLTPLAAELAALVSAFTGRLPQVEAIPETAEGAVKAENAVTDENGKSAPDGANEAEGDKSPVRAMTLRVPMDKLDRLMDMISELEIGRERITRFTSEIAPMAKMLKRERRNLNQTIAAFQKKYQWNSPAGNAAVNPLEDFSDLEFDRYEDLQIFTRNLEDLDFRIATLLKDVEGMLLQFREDSGDIGKSIGNLREEFIALRMIPVDSIFRYLSFQTRELARKLGKKVSVRLYGENTSIDKGIADLLPESLMHMVRNALTHGIESPSERASLGKKEEGTIWFRAYQTGRNVQIEIEDDGAGVNLNRVRETAVRSGLLSPGSAEHCDEARLLDFIFSPHVTTREYVDVVSGRGVGLDAVRHNIAAIYGSVKVESQETRGTKFTITLPLTLALQELLLVRASEQEYLIPMNYVEAVEEIEPEFYDFSTADAVNIIDYRGLKIACRSLHQFTGMECPQQSGKRPVIILHHAENRLGLLVDEIRRREELVVRPMPHILDACEHLVGTTISAQGEVRLVLSVVELFQRERFVSAFDTEKFSLPERVKVLIADDSISVRQTIKRMLEKHGIKANTARDGMLAWQKLHSINPNAMIIDLEMPGLNGYELIQRIKQNRDYDDMAILVLTSRGGNKHRDLAYRSGADGFLTKPVLEKTLISTLRGVLPLDLRELLDEKDQTIE